jgi:hypothetical protein
VLVTDRSAESATCTLVEALLLPGLGSLVAEETESVWVMVDPDAVFVLTLRTRVKVAVLLAVRLAIVQVRLPRLHDQVPGPLSDTEVVFAGRVSVKLTAVAEAGPPLVTV